MVSGVNDACTPAARRLLAESSLSFETALKLATAWESRTRRTFSPERNLQRTSIPLAVTERARYVVTARKERKERMECYRCKGWHDHRYYSSVPRDGAIISMA